MKEVRAAKFKCGKCGGTEVRTYILQNDDQVAMFLAGDPVGTMRRAS
jgi:hypothetical protein